MRTYFELKAVAFHVHRPPACFIGPPDPKISIYRPPPILIFISLMVSLGVGKSQTDEISFKSARISP